MFWFLLLGLLLVIGGVTLAVVRSGVGEGDGRVSGGLADPVPERLAPVLPDERPLVRADVDALRLPLGLRGYRMEEVDDVLDRLGAELSERDARIAELEAALAGNQAVAVGRPDLFTSPGEPAGDVAKPTDAEPAGGGPVDQEPADAEPAEEERPLGRDGLADWNSAPTSDDNRPEGTRGTEEDGGTR